MSLGIGTGKHKVVKWFGMGLGLPGGLEWVEEEVLRCHVCDQKKKCRQVKRNKYYVFVCFFCKEIVKREFSLIYQILWL